MISNADTLLSLSFLCKVSATAYTIPFSELVMSLALTLKLIEYEIIVCTRGLFALPLQKCLQVVRLVVPTSSQRDDVINTQSLFGQLFLAHACKLGSHSGT